MSNSNYKEPLDNSNQRWLGIGDKFPKKIHNATTTSDGLMSAEDKAKLNSIDVNDYNRVYDIATWENDGLMSKEDKKKMDNIEENANNYIHPNNENIRHVTDAQIKYWDAKASTDIVTTEHNGLMSKEDKIKLDGIEENANNYIHPNNENIRHVTDAQIKYWNEKASTDTATWEKDGLMSSYDKFKLDNIDEGANNYIHPDNEGIRHVTDAEKKYWNEKANKTIVTNSENGLMSYIDKIKLDGIEEGANNYVHPDDENHRHVTDEQIKYWNSRAEIDLATTTSKGLMSAEDKRNLEKLLLRYDNIPETGYHEINEVIYASKPVDVGCIGWVCVESGEPGRWVPFGKFNIFENLFYIIKGGDSTIDKKAIRIVTGDSEIDEDDDSIIYVKAGNSTKNM